MGTAPDKQPVGYGATFCHNDGRKIIYLIEPVNDQWLEGSGGEQSIQGKF